MQNGYKDNAKTSHSMVLTNINFYKYEGGNLKYKYGKL